MTHADAVREAERELAARACAAASGEMNRAYHAGFDNKTFFYDSGRAAIRAAILGPLRAKKGARR